jgi:phosphate transport system substrate-binding protein
MKETITLLASFLITAGLLGGGAWIFREPVSKFLNVSSPTATPTSSASPPAIADAQRATDDLNTSLPNPAILTIDGSVTMVTLIKQLEVAYSRTNPDIPTEYGLPNGRPNGSNKGLQNLLDGKVLMSVSSRPLKPEETQRGVVTRLIAKDALAVAVGINNPYKGDLSMQQLKDIFQGRIVNWSQVGGPNLRIRVINRSPDSGTHTFFRDVVLQGEPFAPEGSNFITVKQDETTPLLRALGNDGITYSTVTQVENQKTVRIVSINGISPIDRDTGYPISRPLYLVVPQRTSPAVKQFVDLALSSEGQAIVKQNGFIPLQ